MVDLETLLRCCIFFYALLVIVSNVAISTIDRKIKIKIERIKIILKGVKTEIQYSRAKFWAWKIKFRCNSSLQVWKCWIPRADAREKKIPSKLTCNSLYAGQMRGQQELSLSPKREFLKLLLFTSFCLFFPILIPTSMTGKPAWVYRSWEWVCYLPVICPADSAPSMFPPSYPLYLIPRLETWAGCNLI